MLLINKELNISIKPAKKFQLDMPITCLVAISDSHFALACSNDSKIKIFESNAKKISTFSSHTNNITYIAKIKAEFNGEIIN